MTSTFKTNAFFYPELIENVRDRALANKWRTEVEGDEDNSITVDFSGDVGKAFRDANASAIDAFRQVPHAVLSDSAYAEALSLMKQIAARSRADSPSVSSSLLVASPKPVKALANVSQAQLKNWMSVSDGRINPELLKYIRDSADHFENIVITATSYSSARSMSLSHRKMMTYLITKAGDINIAVRWVDEKVVSLDDADATAAVIAIPRSKIELILCEHGMANKEGAFLDFLWAAYNAKCVYTKGMEDYAPDFIGSGSKAELAKGTVVTAEMKHARRVAFAKSNCNYLRSLMTSQLFINILKSKLPQDAAA